MAFTCPHCNARVLNRKLRFCPECHGVLPADLLLTQSQIDSLSKETDRLRKDAQKSKKQAASISDVSRAMIDWPPTVDVEND